MKYFELLTHHYAWSNKEFEEFPTSFASSKKSYFIRPLVILTSDARIFIRKYYDHLGDLNINNQCIKDVLDPVNAKDVSTEGYTFEPVLSGPVLSGHPLLSGQLSKSRKLLPLITVILTSIKRSPLLSGRGHPLLSPDELFLLS